MPPLTVTTIIPAYRAARFIRRALDSVLGQSQPPEEILVVDDGSPDNTADVVRGYGDRVTLLQKPNGGAASARNLGLGRARGDLVAFLDADDYWVPHKLERQVALFRSRPDLGLVCSRWFTQEPGEGPVPPPPCTDPDFDRAVTATGAAAFSLATRVWTSTVVVRRQVVAGHRFIPGFEPAEDRDLWVRLVTTAPVFVLSEPLAVYVQEPGSLSRGSLEKDYLSTLRVLRRHSNLLGRGERRRWEAEVARRWATRHLGDGPPRAALRPAWMRLLGNLVPVEGL